MATYTYTFDQNIPLATTFSGTLPASVRVNGNFTIDYSADQDYNKIKSYNVFVNGSRLETGVYQQSTNLSGTTTYRPVFFTSNNSTATSNFLYLSYNGQEPNSFVNVELSARTTDYSVFPNVEQSGVYRSQQVAVASTPVCFTTGTLIRTARGEVAVENLIVGDLAVTASGALRPITWIGRRDVDGQGHALSHDQQPIRIRAGAFGPGLPARDLRLSHGHPVLVAADVDGARGVLVPIMCLINGTSVVREAATRVTYWHVELDSHDILLAEGLSAESFYDMSSRIWFAGEDGVLTDPDFVPAGEHGRCRPVVIDGPVVEAERRRLNTAFVTMLSDQCDWQASAAFR